MKPTRLEVVLRPEEILADVVLGRPVGSRLHEPIAEVPAKIAGQTLDRLFAHPQQQLVARAAAERQQPGGSEVVVVDEDAGAEAERPDAPAGLLGDHAPDGERLAADHDALSGGDAKLGEQLRSHQGAAVLQQIVREGCAILQLDLAVKRKPALHTAQLHHPRRGRAFLRPDHRGRFDGFHPLEDVRAREPLIEPAPDLVGPRAVRSTRAHRRR